MKKKILGLLLFSMVFMALASGVDAMPPTPGEEIINSDMYQHQILAQNQTMLHFRNRTRVRINSSVDVNVNIDCDALEIGEQNFSLEILEADGELELNMTCRREETQLGVQAGATIRNRNRNQFRIHTAIAVKLQANGTCEAKLGLGMSEEEAQNKEWAYFNGTTNEWVPVESSYQDGELIAMTDHFSVWSVIETTPTIGLPTMIFGGITAAAVVASLLYYKKRVKLA